MNTVRSVVVALPLLLLGMTTTTAFADDSPQSTGLSSLFGSISGALNKVRDAAQNVQTKLSPDAQGSFGGADQTNAQSDPMVTMSDADKQLMGQGMWHDPRTGLIWMRCPLKRTWDGTGCSKDTTSKSSGASYSGIYPAVRDVSQMSFGGYSDWRLPTIEELYGLFDTRKCAASTFTEAPKNGGVDTLRMPSMCSSNENWVSFINTKIFPISEFTDATNSRFYSASTTCSSDSPVPKNETTWLMDFNRGARCDNLSSDGGDLEQGHVFAVRGGSPTGEYQYVLANTNEYYAQQKIKQTANAAEQARSNAALKQRRADYYAEVAAFRKSVRVGDRATQGLVLEINGDLIRVQTYIPACNSRFDNCTGPEKWINRNELVPH
jgi:hypothetical protein